MYALAHCAKLIVLALATTARWRAASLPLRDRCPGASGCAPGEPPTGHRLSRHGEADPAPCRGCARRSCSAEPTTPFPPWRSTDRIETVAVGVHPRHAGRGQPSDRGKGEPFIGALHVLSPADPRGRTPVSLPTKATRYLAIRNRAYKGMSGTLSTTNQPLNGA